MEDSRPGEERIKVLDFGIAKLSPAIPAAVSTNTARTQMKTLVGSVMGTARYMPPEQWGQAEDVDSRADVFALGVILYDLLSGKMPYEGNSRSLLINPARPLSAVAPKVAPRLTQLVDRMLEVTVAKRPQMDEVLCVLAALRPLRMRSRDLLLGGGVGVAVVLAIVGVWEILVPRLRPLTPSQARLNALELLAAHLSDTNSEHRKLAVRALGDSRDPTQRGLIEQRLRTDSEEVATSAASALGALGSLLARPALREQLGIGRPMPLRLASASALARLQDPQGRATLLELLQAKSIDVRGRAAQRLAALGDSQGASILWQYLESSGSAATLTPDSIGLLGLLAKCRDERALQRLRDEFGRQSSLEIRSHLAAQLAMVGDEEARSFLRTVAQLAAGSSPTGERSHVRLLAARLLASLGEPVPKEFFLAVLRQAETPDPIRLLAIEGLGDSADEGLSAELGTLLARGPYATSLRVRLNAAWTIVRLTAGTAAQLAEQSLAWAQAALSSDEIDLRLLGVDILASQSSEVALQGLLTARENRNQRVRERAVQALAKRGVRTALRALTLSLTDSDEDVRAATVSAIEQVLQALRQRGEADGDSSLREQLQRMARSSSLLDRVASAALLQRLQDTSGAETLREALTAADRRVRRIAVEFARVPADQLAQRLTDEDCPVRLTAARRMAEMKDERGLRALRDQVEAGGLDGLTAFVYLRQLGVPSAAPTGLASLLQDGSLLTRSAVLDVVQEMEGAEAIRLLKIAALDPGTVLRGRTVRIAAALYQRNPVPALLDLVRTLRGDPDVYVQLQVSQVLPAMEGLAVRAGLQPAQAAKVAGPGETKSAPQPLPAVKPAPVPSFLPSPKSGPTEGTVVVKGEKGVRYQIDRSPSRELGDRPVSLVLTAGKHRLNHATGFKPFEIAGGQALELSHPLTFIEQLVADAQQAAKNKDWSELERLLAAVTKLSTGHVPSREAEVSYLRGVMLEARLGLAAALSAYNQSLSVAVESRRPETNAALDALLKRIASRVVRQQYQHRKGGKCVVTKEVLWWPGRIELGDEIKELPGGHVEPMPCVSQ